MLTQFPRQDSDDSGEVLSMDLEEQGNGSIADESASPNSNYGDVDNEADLSRMEESEMFISTDGAANARVSPSPSVESSSSIKHPSSNTSPVMFGTASTETSPQNSITKQSSKSSSPTSDVDAKISPKTVHDEPPKQIERLHVKTEEGPRSPLVAKISPKMASFESPKAKIEPNEAEAETHPAGDQEKSEGCTCWRRPLIDQIFITDVTSNLVTVTVRESYTDKGFFRKRT